MMSRKTLRLLEAILTQAARDATTVDQVLHIQTMKAYVLDELTKLDEDDLGFIEHTRALTREGG